MKTWTQSAASSAKFTGWLLFWSAIAFALWQVGAWFVSVAGTVFAILVAASIVFGVGTVLVRVVSRVISEREAERRVKTAEAEARRAKIDAKIQRAQAMAHQASSWRPDAPMH